MTHEVKYGFSQPCKAFAFKITDSIFTKSIILNRVILYDSLIWIACSMIHMIWLIFNSPKLGRVIFLCIHWYQCRTHLFELNTLLDIRNDIRHPDFCTALHLVVEIVLVCFTGSMSKWGKNRVMFLPSWLHVCVLSAHSSISVHISLESFILSNS